MTARILSFVVLGFVSTLGVADEKVAQPFNGKSLEGWKVKGDNTAKSKWTVGVAKMDEKSNGQLAVTTATENAELVNAAGGGVDLYSEAKFGSCTITLEVMVPKGSNSGIYVMGNYEIQVLDSFGKQKVGPGDIGGLYGAAAPSVNAAKAPGEWQTFVIDFTAPRFENGKKVANARFDKVVLNGQTIHQNVELKGATPGNLGQGEQPTGPILFQGDHGPVAYRNIRVVSR